MKSLTFEELKTWVKDHKENLKGLNIRVSTSKNSFPFTTLKSFGEYILKLEKSYQSARVHSYSTNGFIYKNFSYDLNEIKLNNLKSIEILIG